MDRAKLEGYISELKQLRIQLMIADDEDPNDTEEFELFTPAEEPEIDRFLQEQNGRISNSFRTFLMLHNGWRGFWPDWSLVGVPSDANQDMYDDIQMNLDLLPDVVGDDETRELQEKEKVDPEVIALENHVILATDFNGSFLVFDNNRINESGEHEIAWVENLMHVERRWTDFESLFQNAIASTKEDIEDA